MHSALIFASSTTIRYLCSTRIGNWSSSLLSPLNYLSILGLQEWTTFRRVPSSESALPVPCILKTAMAVYSGTTPHKLCVILPCIQYNNCSLINIKWHDSSELRNDVIWAHLPSIESVCRALGASLIGVAPDWLLCQLLVTATFTQSCSASCNYTIYYILHRVSHRWKCSYE